MYNHSIFHRILCIAFILAFVLCTLGSAFAEALRVAVVQPLSHTSLNQIRDTIVSELEGSDVEFEIVTRNAEGDSAALSTILENVKSDGVDILVPIATNTAQSAKMVFEDTGVPVVFAAVSDPVAAGLTGDDCGFITGVSNNIPAAEIVNLNGKAFHPFPRSLRKVSDRRLHALLLSWLKSLPRPCGIFAANDYVAQIVLEACAQLRIDVPTEFAVVGVDNEERICENTRPTLTSVLPDNDRTGYMAAELLDGMMRGDRQGGRTFGVLTVVRRQSTCPYRRSDARVLAAVETIRRQACEGLTARAVIAEMGCSRRLAEMRFREVTGHSILDEITEIRLANARMMLRDSRKTVEMVAASCGYNSPVALRKAFLSHTGETLSAWRERQKGKSPL